MEEVKQQRQQFVVVGLGIFGSTVATTLSELGKDVLCVDKNEELVQNIADKVTLAVVGDARDESVLKQLDVQTFDVAIVGIGNKIESSLMVTLALKEVGVKYVIAKAVNDTHERALYKIGADRVIRPEKDMGKRVARNAVRSKLIDYIEVSDSYSIFEINCPTSWVGHTPIELDVRQNFGVTILGIKRNNEFLFTTEHIVPFEETDVIILLGQPDDFYSQLDKIEH
jgi:trk system potassium uptake protein TrkA